MVLCNDSGRLFQTSGPLIAKSHWSQKPPHPGSSPRSRGLWPRSSLRISPSKLPCYQLRPLAALQWKPRDPTCSFVTIGTLALQTDRRQTESYDYSGTLQCNCNVPLKIDKWSTVVNELSATKQIFSLWISTSWKILCLFSQRNMARAVYTVLLSVDWSLAWPAVAGLSMVVKLWSTTGSMYPNDLSTGTLLYMLFLYSSATVTTGSKLLSLNNVTKKLNTIRQHLFYIL